MLYTFMGLLYDQTFSEKMGAAMREGRLGLYQRQPFEQDTFVAERAWRSTTMFSEPYIQFTHFHRENGDAALRWLVEIPLAVIEVLYALLQHVDSRPIIDVVLEFVL